VNRPEEFSFVFALFLPHDAMLARYMPSCQKVSSLQPSVSSTAES